MEGTAGIVDQGGIAAHMKCRSRIGQWQIGKAQMIPGLGEHFGLSHPTRHNVHSNLEDERRPLHR